jgi:hypothetical protein
MHNKRLKGHLTLIVLLLISCNLPLPILNQLSGDNDGSQTLNQDSGSEIDETGETAPIDPTTPGDDVPPPPDFSEIELPTGFGEFEERDGVWYLNDSAVELVYNRDANGELDLWLTFAGKPDFPILIRTPNGVWGLGAKAWSGEVTFINTLETTASVAILANDEQVFAEDLSPYEVYNLASLPQGAFVFHFEFSGEEPFDLNCAFTLAPDSVISFVILPVGVAIVDPSFSPQSGADLDVRTSPLCGGEE